MYLAQTVDQDRSQKAKTLRCAIYVRKSTDEGMNSDFTSLDAQREYCGAFIKSREPEGWQAFDGDYTDPGYSGGNMDRPALRKLMSHAQEGKFQVVVCYKYDRLSRNTKDFLHILDVFDRHGVAFVSVTQPIDTTSSIGRLMRSILMDFAQFEREMISERTRDKMSAMAKKGKWLGSSPILGYDYNPKKKLLELNEAEAPQVVDIFNTYLAMKSLSETAKAVNAKGYRMKSWIPIGKSVPKGGRPFNRCNLFSFLKNSLFLAKIKYKGHLYDAQHPAIVPQELFQKVGERLKANWRGAVFRVPKEGARDYLLKGIIRCASCGYAMTPNFAHSKGKTFYYYKCVPVIKNGPSACTVRSVSAPEIERVIVERLGILARTPGLVERVIEKVRTLNSDEIPAKLREKAAVASEMGRLESDAANLVAVLAEQGPESPQKKFIMKQLEELNTRLEEKKARQERLCRKIQDLEETKIDAEVVRTNLQSFERVFQALTPGERKELLQLVVKEVIYDKPKGVIRLTLNPLPRLHWNLGQEGVVLICAKNGVSNGI